LYRWGIAVATACLLTLGMPSPAFAAKAKAKPGPKHVPPGAEVVIGHADNLGLAEAMQARAIIEHGLRGAQISQEGPRAFDVFLGPFGTFKEAQTVRWYIRGAFRDVTVKSQAKPHGVLIETPAEVLASAAAAAAASSASAAAAASSAASSAAGSSAAAPASASAPPAAASPAPAVAQTYTVVKGDTLWDLAQHYYGNGFRWTLIADANGVKNPRLLQIGTVLTIPPGP
jgi:LysM repeat protein